MKKLLSATLALLLLLSALACITVSPVSAAKVPTAEDMGGYENLCLTYTFRYGGSDNGRHYEQDLLPYTAYLDKNGNIKDFFFDSYLFLPCMGYGPSGARMHLDAANPTKAIDWTTYVDDTFAKNANVDALEKAYGKTKAALGDTDSKAGVFFTLLYPGKGATNFGTLGGRSLNFSKLEDRKYAIKWMIDEQIAKFEARGYQHLDLVGFYWLEEYIADNEDPQLLRYASQYLHSKGLKFIWIPWYKANGYQNWKSYGFDVACMQPNLMWLGYHDPARVQTSVQISQQHGLSMEMECDGKVYTDEYFGRYLDYLESGMNSSMMSSVKMYYQDGKTAVYYKACYSDDPQYRMVYDLTYKYAKKTLKQSDIDPIRPATENNAYKVVDDIGLDSLIEKDVDWVSIGKSYSGCASYVDGNGADYQKADGKELTDGILATDDLSTDWHAYHHSILDSQGKMSTVIDLGEVRNDLTHFYAHFDNKMDYGIGSPVGIVVSVSKDGRTFEVLEKPTLYADSTNSCIKLVTDPVTARYVKISFGVSGGAFVFCSEFLVGVGKNTDPEESEPEISTPTEESKEESKDTSSEESIEESTEESIEESVEESEESKDTSMEESTAVTESEQPDDSSTEETLSEAPDTTAEPSAEPSSPPSSQSGENNHEGGNPTLWIVIAIVAVAAVVAVILIRRKK